LAEEVYFVLAHFGSEVVAEFFGEEVDEFAVKVYEVFWDVDFVSVKGEIEVIEDPIYVGDVVCGLFAGGGWWVLEGTCCVSCFARVVLESEACELTD
jgi:hypothetical protein